MSGAVLTMRFDEALAFAVEKHRRQIRKVTGAPYVTHLLSVAALVGELGGDETQMMAALLHDAIEDQGVTADELASRFGHDVAAIVVACSDVVATPKPAWGTRKEAYVARMRTQSGRVKLVAACDKLHNAQSIARDARNPAIGARVWESFTMPRADSIRFYQSVLAALRHGWEHPVLGELALAVAALEDAARG